ncbi:DEAD/DEAH box helicase [Lactococcus lactis]|uniref:DEAD/DEAH box helicase n=1 Tax=Lactococcus lactis TaxID=1358 RepID=UPI0021A2C216|nr:DEAD/DEAH box helicase [Lactococcus lactis]MCT3086238.1 DEAD/DEAH box helicase [Lactococcus lactis]
MVSNEKSILTRIKNNEQVKKSIEELLYIKSELSNFEAEYLLSVALVFIREYEDNSNNKMFIEYAYFIIAKVSYKTNDYRALYDFSVNYGYFPIAKKILDLNLIPNLTMNHIFTELAIEEFSDGTKVQTLEQKNVFSAVLEDENKSVSFIAPTSYGKSELIFQHLKKNNNKDMVGIIVPTKALIDQVYRDSKAIVKDRKIIIHDQNFEPSSDHRVLAIVTQERALRLLDSGMVFDILYIDEAHELLNFDFRNGFSNRSLLLTRVINVSRAKNSELLELYLSPAIVSDESLTIRNSLKVANHKISNNLKLLDIDFLNNSGENLIYDRFLGDFIFQKEYKRTSDYIFEKSLNKNLHFLYRPKYIEEYSNILSNSLPTVFEIPSEILELIEELKLIVHPKFKLIKYLEKGLVYLHGRMPQVIKNYLLKYVRESDFITHFVANSVVLAGMNLPIDNLFYLSGYANIRDLYNLIGRVNRLNEIFSPQSKDISRIFIPIHFIEMNQFPQNKNGNLKKKIEKLRGNYKDEIKNPMLDNATIDANNREMADEIVSSEIEIIKSFDNPKFKEKLLRAGAQQLLNYSEQGMNILETRIQKIIKPIDDDYLLETIKKLFFDDFKESDFKPQYNAERLKHAETINYYKLFIKGLNIYSLSERIERLVGYWNSKIDEKYMIYVGTQFGEVTKESKRYFEPRNKVYVDLDEHIGDMDYLYNLAILKLQTDEDYVGHEITLLLNTLLEFEIITQEQFDRLIYGTTSQDDIRILRLGISRTIYRKLKKDNKVNNIIFDNYGNARADHELKKYIEIQTGIEKFELEQYFIS